MGIHWYWILYMKGGNKEMFKIFKKALSIDAKKKGGYAEAHEIN